LTNSEKSKADLVKELEGLRRQIGELKELNSENLAAVIRDSAEGIIVIDLQGTVLFGNPASEKILQRDSDAVIGMRFGVPVHGGDPIEIDILTPSGAMVPVELWARPTTWEGKPALRVSVRDLTEKRAAEQAARESDKQYKALYNSIRDAILVADIDRNIIDCNEAFTETFGYLLDELKGKKTSFLYANGEEFIQLGNAMEDHHAGDALISVIYYKCKNGKIFPGETSVYNLTNDANEAIGRLGLIRDISDRLEAEKTLRENQELLKRTEHLAKTGGWELDPITGQQKWTEGVYNIHKVDLDFEPTVEKGISFYAPEAQAVITQAVEKAIEQGAPFEVELPFITAEGRQLWVRAVGKAKRKDGITEKVEGTFQDITEQKNAEDLLLQSRGELEALLQNIQAGVVAYGPDTAIIRCNREASKLLGLSVNHLLGKTSTDPCWNFVDENGRKMPPEEHPVNLVIKSGQGLKDYLLGIRRSDRADIIWVLINANPIHDQSGDLSQVILSFIDMSDHIAAQQTISSLATIVRSSHDAIISKDLNGIIISWNQAAERTYGYSVQEAVGQNISLIVPEGQREEMESTINAVRRGEAVSIHKTVRQHKDGSLVDVALHTSPVKDNRGRTIGAATIAHVITEIKNARAAKERLEARLRQAQKMEAIGTLAGGIAHDFNNMLAAIMGYSELALGEMPADSEPAEHLNKVMEFIKRAKDLIYQILYFSRQTEQQRSFLDLGVVCKEVFNMLRPILPSTIEIRQNMPVGKGMVNAETVQIQQIIMNLCINASQAMEPSGGVLNINLDSVDIDEPGASKELGLPPGKYQRLIVSDTGIGMTKETLERIFDPFFTTKGIGQGTGMGLSVVHGIVADHGGAIKVYSEPGEGSTFHIYLPEVVDAAEIKEYPSESKEIPRGSESILLVDDERSLVEIGQKALSGLGYKVHGYTSADDALEAFRIGPDDFDLVITDYTMPLMTGVQLAKECLAIKADMPIIMCTGFAERLSCNSQEENGITRLALKPFMLGDMARLIREALNKG
jgi:PAS domain S-box-containing protein